MGCKLDDSGVKYSTPHFRSSAADPSLEWMCYTEVMPRMIRASEIGSHLYCRRAWWYRKQGVASQNQAELAAGTELHVQHGRNVLAAGLLQMAGMFCFSPPLRCSSTN